MANQTLIMAAFVAALAGGCASSTTEALKAEKPPRLEPTLSGEPPIVIGHRGASGYLPEHTLAAYERAIDMGADFIEPDLVSTKDGVLIARHENEISGTTDVATVFPDRKGVKTIDGKKVEGWFSEDFTHAEIQKLRARERLDFRPQFNNGRYPVPKFADILKLVRQQEKKLGRKIGLYIETKHPSYFRAIGLPLEEKLLLELKKAGFRAGKDPLFIQSFEVGNLRWLRARTGFPLVQLLGDPDRIPPDLRDTPGAPTYGRMAEAAGLAEIARYARGVGPEKAYIVPVSLFGGLGEPTDFVRRAHHAGLVVHPYTFRADPIYLAGDYEGDPHAEYRLFYALGVDGVFSDFPDQAVETRTRLFPARK